MLLCTRSVHFFFISSMPPYGSLISDQLIYLGKSPADPVDTLLFYWTVLTALGQAAMAAYFVHTQNLVLLRTGITSLLIAGVYLTVVSSSIRRKLKRKMKKLPASDKQARAAAAYNCPHWNGALLMLLPYISFGLSISFHTAGNWVIFVSLAAAFFSESFMKKFILAYQKAKINADKESEVMSRWEAFSDWVYKKQLDLQTPEALVANYQEYAKTLTK